MRLPQVIPRWFDWLWLGALAIYMVSGAAIAPFHGDESTLMVMSRDYHTLFGEGDLSKVYFDPTWQNNPHEQQLRLLNGSVSKIIYGWLGAMNGFGPRDTNRDWRWGKDYDANSQSGAIPDAELLRQARLASSVQLALAAALLFQFAKLTINRPTAYLAASLFALHPNMLINGRRAMMEGSHILGLMLVLMAAAWLLQERRWRRYLLLGASAGFAIAAKHPNASICALVFLACSVDPLWRLLRCSGKDWRKPALDLAGIALAGALTGLVFLFLNPVWWNDPLAVAPVVIDLRQALLQDQVNIFGGYTSLADRLHGLFQFGFAGERQYFEALNWATYDAIGAQIAAYERSGLAGLLVIGSSARLGLISLLLALFGLVHLARNRSVTAEHRLLLLIWIVGSALVTLRLNPLPWARYYLPLLPAVIVLVSYALARFAAVIRQSHGA